MHEHEPFSLPDFASYPPFYTLQPVADTLERQKGLWGQLILDYCRHKKIYAISTGTDFPLFHNRDINRSLQPKAIEVFLDHLVSQGNAEWLDGSKQRCLILWKKVADWANVIYEYARQNGKFGNMELVEDLCRGEDVQAAAPELFEIDKELLMRALKVLESRGKAQFIRITPEEEGVKIFM